MNGVFFRASSFNSNLQWNTSLVNDIAHIFDGCTNFNGYIGGWDTSRVTQMRNVFNGCTLFNQNVRRWNTSAVISMNSMFRGCTNFNQEIGVTTVSWDTSRVTDMQHMFDGATNFNNGRPCRATFTMINNGTTTLINTMILNTRSLGGTGSNFMFNNTPCFNAQGVNTWVVPIDRANSGGLAFRRNSGLEDRRTPPNILNFAPNGGR
jgi:hypothetical protein